MTKYIMPVFAHPKGAPNQLQDAFIRQVFNFLNNEHVLKTLGGNVDFDHFYEKPQGPALQLAYALAYFAPEYFKKILDGKINWADLKQAKPLRGHSILDLGSGPTLNFPKIAAALGAHVTAVDIEEPNPRFRIPVDIEGQVTHVRINLNDPEQRKKIQGKFGMVTSHFISWQHKAPGYEHGIATTRFWQDVERWLKPGGLSLHHNIYALHKGQSFGWRRPRGYTHATKFLGTPTLIRIKQKRLPRR